MGEKFAISPIEMIVLRKLVLVNYALATKLQYGAAQEQQCLTEMLETVLTRYEICRAEEEHPNG